jgi:hypothetical protein
MNDCELCHSETRNRSRTGKRNELLCNDCRRSTEYYDSLTPQQWREELRMMAAYVAESEGRADE